MQITLIIPAVPVGQPRPRATSFCGHARVYDQTVIENQNTGVKKPHPIVLFKATVRLIASQTYTGTPLTGPLCVDCLFLFPRPARMMWKKRPMPRVPHTSKPDRDNCDKAILDSLAGIILANDCQVYDGQIQKFYAAGDEQAHVEIVITEWVAPEAVNFIAVPNKQKQLTLEPVE